VLGSHELTSLVHGYGALFVFAVVGLQALCVPVPGTTALLLASLYAGATHRLSIAAVILAGVLGVLVGSGLAFAIGRAGGERLLGWLGRRRRIGEARARSAVALAHAHAGKLVFFGRWITGVRNIAGLASGASGMPARRFALLATLAAVAWATSTGLENYYFGRAIESAGTWVQIVLILAGALWVVVSLALLRRRALRAVQS
jgi:membrane protein DedA with SNARE-associated domain